MNTISILSATDRFKALANGIHIKDATKLAVDATSSLSESEQTTLKELGVYGEFLLASMSEIRLGQTSSFEERLQGFWRRSFIEMIWKPQRELLPKPQPTTTM